MGRKKKHNIDVYDIVAANIKKYRIESGFTQEQLVDKNSYAPEYIRRIESSKRTCGISIEIVYGISKTLGIDMVECFKNEKESSSTLNFINFLLRLHNKTLLVSIGHLF